MQGFIFICRKKIVTKLFCCCYLFFGGWFEIDHASLLKKHNFKIQYIKYDFDMFYLLFNYMYIFVFVLFFKLYFITKSKSSSSSINFFKDLPISSEFKS